MKSLLIILFTFITSFSIMGQKMYIDIKTTTPSPGVGEKFKVSYILKLKMNGGMASISHNGVKINKPSFNKGFVVIQEGNESTSFGFGGRKDIEISKYSFILQAKKKGKFEIAPLSFFINGEQVKSGIFTINVGTGNPNTKIQTSDPNLFARIEPNKRSIYKGEPVTVTYKVYTRYTGFAIEDYEMPMTNGLWKEEIKPGSKGWPQTTQVVNGINYNVLTLKKEVIIPQKTGKIKLEPIKIKAQIGRSIWRRGQQKTINSNSPTLTVKSLPTPKPNNFSDQVGSNYKLNLTYSTNQLKTNEPLDVKLTISGKGNLKQLTNLSLNFPTDFEVFDPEIKDQVKISSSGISGKKTFNYLVIPRHRGTFEIPGYKFTYFDVKNKKYKTLIAPAQTITVEKGENEIETTNQTPGVDKQNVEILNTGIRHIKDETILYAKKDAIYNTFFFWFFILMPFIVALVLYFIIIFKRNTNEDETVSKRKYANKNASSKLKKAALLLSENKDLEFYEELNKALSDYCSHKLLIPTATLTKANITTALADKKVNDTTIKLLIQILDECEMARFSPVSHAGAERTLTNATTIINQIEQDVKK